MRELRRLLGYLGPYRRDLLIAAVMIILETAFEMVIPVLMADIIDVGVANRDVAVILQRGIQMGVCALLALATGLLYARFTARAAYGWGANIREAQFERVQKYAFSNLDKFETSSLVTRMTTDVTVLQNTVNGGYRPLVRSPVMLVMGVGLSFWMNPRLALVFLVCAPVLGGVLFVIVRRVAPMYGRLQKAVDRLNNVVQENLLGIRVVKSFVREEHEKEKFGKVSQEIYMDFSKAEKLIAFNMPLMQLCVYACILTVSWLSAHLVVGGSMDVGQLTSMFSYIMMILMSLMMLSMVLVMIILARASAERITELLNEESDLRNGENPVEEVKDGSVVFENVSFSYAKDPSKECLKNVNLNIKSGETVGILGGTGTSKTTLVQLIPRLYDATEGRILVGGVDVRDYDMDALREQVAMVLQKNVLFSGTIKENLRWGKKDATDEEMVRVCKLAQADPFIQEFPDKYDTYIEQGGSNVSGGQKQRLCIARALLKKPKILILDDSTSAVDTKTDALIRKAFREEIPDTTKFIIAQRISSIEDADKILVMDGGRISAMGTHGELLQSCEIYREIYESQTKGGSEDE